MSHHGGQDSGPIVTTREEQQIRLLQQQIAGAHRVLQMVADHCRSPQGSKELLKMVQESYPNL